MENFRLTVFREVAHQLSFRKASEALNLSQPAVSQQIRALEEETGVRLFDRATGDGHGSQIALTEAGRVLLGYATTSAATLDEARLALAALNQTVTGELRLAASTTVAQYLLPRILGPFLREHPQIKLSLISGNTEHVVEQVANQRATLGIIEGPAMRRDLKTERLVEDHMVLIANPQHPWAARRPRRIQASDLAISPLLLRERGSGSRRIIERALKLAGLPLRSLNVIMELDSTEAILSGVEAGLGVGFVSRWAIGKAVRLGTIRAIAVEGIHIVRGFSFIHTAGTELTGAAAAFQRFARGLQLSFESIDTPDK
jgi:LysR family transcriptional regulator, transcriptional activator of the cysJI operon